MISKIKAWFAKLWLEHGTKVLGWLTTINGGMVTAIIAAKDLLALSKTEIRVLFGFGLLTTFLGATTVKRGHTNTLNAPPPPAPQSDKEPDIK